MFANQICSLHEREKIQCLKLDGAVLHYNFPGCFFFILEVRLKMCQKSSWENTQTHTQSCFHHLRGHQIESDVVFEKIPLLQVVCRRWLKLTTEMGQYMYVGLQIDPTQPVPSEQLTLPLTSSCFCSPMRYSMLFSCSIEAS